MEAAKNVLDDTMQSKPLVSVIMPVYNSEKYLISAIRSVLEQTYDNFELICVDDGSTDLSPEILRLQQPDSHLKIITQKNQGPSAARNAGLDVAQGDYIAFGKNSPRNRGGYCRLRRINVSRFNSYTSMDRS